MPNPQTHRVSESESETAPWIGHRVGDGRACRSYIIRTERHKSQNETKRSESETTLTCDHARRHAATATLSYLNVENNIVQKRELQTISLYS